MGQDEGKFREHENTINCSSRCIVNSSDRLEFQTIASKRRSTEGVRMALGQHARRTHREPCEQPNTGKGNSTSRGSREKRVHVRPTRLLLSGTAGIVQRLAQRAAEELPILNRMNIRQNELFCLVMKKQRR
jgi:hypothetical protein